MLVQGNLRLTAEELNALLVFAIWLISKVVAVRWVLMTKFKIVSSRFHKWFPLTQIKIKYVINVRTNRDFITCIVAIKRVYIPLYHCVMKFLTLIELPSIHAFLQFTWIKAILIIFFLSIFFASFFFGFTFRISLALNGIFLIFLEFTLRLLILSHCFKSLCFSAFLHIFKFLFQTK